MPALAITDHGVLSGIIQFYQQCLKAGIKPIIGLEAYLVEDRFRKEGQNEERWHLTLLARDDSGYRNLLKLGSLAFLEGYYYKPRMDYAALREHAEGLICLSGCASGRLSKALQFGQFAAADAEVERLVRDLRQGERLPGDTGDRHPRAGRGEPAPGGVGGTDRPETGGHQRRPLPARGRRHRARRAALHPDRLAAFRGEPPALLVGGVLPQERRRDAGRLPGSSPGVGHHPGGGRALQRGDQARRDAHPAFPGPRGVRRSLVSAGAVREGIDAPLRERGVARGAGAPRDRAGGGGEDGLPALLPHRVGLRQLRQAVRHRRGPGPGLGRGLAGLLPAGHHRPRSHHLRPAVRALPQSRPHQHARHRHRLLGQRPGEGHRLRGQQVRARPGGPDRHLRHHQGPPGHPRRRPGHGRALRPGRPHRQAGAGGAQHHPRRLPGRRQGRAARRLRQRRRGARSHRHGPAPGGAHPSGLHPRRRRGHLQGAAHRASASHAEGRRRGGHPGVHERRGEAGPAQDGLPGSAQPGRHRQRRRRSSERAAIPSSISRPSPWTTRPPTRCWPRATPRACSSSNRAACARLCATSSPPGSTISSPWWRSTGPVPWSSSPSTPATSATRGASSTRTTAWSPSSAPPTGWRSTRNSSWRSPSASAASHRPRPTICARPSARRSGPRWINWSPSSGREPRPRAPRPGSSITCGR